MKSKVYDECRHTPIWNALYVAVASLIRYSASGAEEEKEASSSEDEDSESKVTEMRFIPADKDACKYW